MNKVDLEWTRNWITEIAPNIDSDFKTWITGFENRYSTETLTVMKAAWNEAKKTKCGCCGREKPDVSVRLDPYAADIDGEKNYWAMCDHCEEARRDDI